MGEGGDKGWGEGEIRGGGRGEIRGGGRGEIRGGGWGKEDMGQLTAIRKPDFLWSVT